MKNKHTPYYTSNYLSSDDDDYYQPDIFAPFTQEHRVQKPRQNQASQNISLYPQNSASTQTHQPLQMQNPTSTQSYQSVQIQNPVSTHSYQPTQMQNEILYHITYNNMKQERVNLQTSHKYQMPQNHYK